MPKKIAQDWAVLEDEVIAAGVSRAEIEDGARRLLAETSRAQLAERRPGHRLVQRESPGHGRECH